jgi:L-threonylcarbamoyladenylate synthase
LLSQNFLILQKICPPQRMIGTDIETAKYWLKRNDVVGVPTETVYGLAANAFDTDAVLRIFTVKNRPHFDPLIVHTHTIAEVKNFVTDFPKPLRALAEAFWPGPLTLLLPKKHQISDLVTSGLNRVGVRVPNHPLTLALLRSLDFPLAAPSANPFGYISPTCAAHVEAQLGANVPYILDGGNCGVGIESTIVGIENNEIVVYRLGGLSVERMETVVGTTLRVREQSSSQPAAPGMLLSHYAPRKRLIIIDNILKTLPQNVAFLGFQNRHGSVPTALQRILSVAGDTHEAAKNLFAYLRELDDLPVAEIYTELLPDSHLGSAINDRLRRAAA